MAKGVLKSGGLERLVDGSSPCSDFSKSAHRNGVLHIRLCLSVELQRFGRMSFCYLFFEELLQALSEGSHSCAVES